MHGHAAPAELRIKPAGHREQRVADGLAFEPAQVRAVQQEILRVEFLRPRVGGCAGHLVSAREHQLAHELLERPLLLAHEPRREMVEQFRVRRCLPEHAEVVHGRHDAAAEQMVPHAVHDDACREGIRRVGDLLRELQAPAARAVGNLLRAAEGFEKPPLRRGGGRLRHPAHEEEFIHAIAVEDGGRGAGIGFDLRDEFRLLRGEILQRDVELCSLRRAGRTKQIHIPHEPVSDLRVAHRIRRTGKLVRLKVRDGCEANRLHRAGDCFRRVRRIVAEHRDQIQHRDFRLTLRLRLHDHRHREIVRAHGAELDVRAMARVG